MAGKQSCQTAREFKVTVALKTMPTLLRGEAGLGHGKMKSRLLRSSRHGHRRGIILDGQLYAGWIWRIRNQPTVIDPSGRDCSCGYRGCWESLATGPRWRMVQRECSGRSTLSRKLDRAQICQLANVERVGYASGRPRPHYLGLGVANLIIYSCRK